MNPILRAQRLLAINRVLREDQEALLSRWRANVYLAKVIRMQRPRG